MGKYVIWFDVLLGNGAQTNPMVAADEPTVGWLFHNDEDSLWDFTSDKKAAKRFDSAPEAFDAVRQWMPDMQVIEIKVMLDQP